MTKHDLKELAAMGAELGAAKAENERLIEVLELARSHIVELCTVMNIPLPDATIRRIDSAQSQQAEPTDTYTAVDMATAAAQGFRDGQAAMEPAPAQDEREAFESWYLEDTGFGPESLTRDAHGDYVDPDAVSCWEGWQARATRPAQTEQQPATDVAELVNNAERWRYVRQFLSLDDVGDEEFCLGLVVDYDGLESAVTPHAARLHAERCAAEWVVDADYVGDISPLPPVTVEQAIDAALAASTGQQPVSWQFYQDGKWWNGDDRIKDHRKNTEAAGIPVRDLYAAPIAQAEHDTFCAYCGGNDEEPQDHCMDCTRPLAQTEQQPDPVLCDFYEADDYPSLTSKLVGHVKQLQEAAQRNVKPWEDTFPPTLLPAYIRRIEAAAPIAQTAPQHPDDAAVDRFAAAMKAKLAVARAKGRGGWDNPSVCTVEFLAQLLVEHLGKGNAGTFEDVANFAMMLHQRGADPMVLAEAAEAPIKKARGEALELGVRALESKSEHTEPAPALDVHYSKGFTDQSGDCGKFEAGINVGTWMQRIVAYGDTAEDAERMRDVILEALARPAQTEQQPAYVECRECTDCGHVGINDAHQTDATCAMCDWSGPSPVEDQCPDCGTENVMGAACPKCSGRYRILAETHVAAPIAQTAPQQSGWISVEDRLPPIRQILSDSCVLEGKEIPTLYRSADVICWDGKRVGCQIVEWFHAKMPIGGVTHWMPLPAAPAQGGEG